VQPHQPVYEEMTHEMQRLEHTSEIAGGRIQIIGIGNAEIVSVNAISIPLRLKIEGDNRVFKMDVAIKLDKIKPEE
jgi:hypothetical protein